MRNYRGLYTLNVVFKNKNGIADGNVELLGLYKSPDKAVLDALEVWDDTVGFFLIGQEGSGKYLQLKKRDHQ